MSYFQVLLFCYAILYFILAGQAVFYKFCFTRVFGAITGLQFVAIRNLADPLLATRLALVYYASLGTGLAFWVASIITGPPAPVILSTLSFLLLLTDVVLAKKYNVPLNTRIAGLIDPSEQVAAQLQSQWLRWIDRRGNFVLAGFFVLLFQIVFFR